MNAVVSKTEIVLWPVQSTAGLEENAVVDRVHMLVVVVVVEQRTHAVSLGTHGSEINHSIYFRTVCR